MPAGYKAGEEKLFLYHDLLTTVELDYIKRNALNLLTAVTVPHSDAFYQDNLPSDVWSGNHW